MFSDRCLWHLVLCCISFHRAETAKDTREIERVYNLKTPLAASAF